MFDYDVFLSHAAADAHDADAVRHLLLAANFRVYCDRYDDPALDRSHVTSATAERLRKRMRQSNSMLYVASARAPVSKWMPWELGFFDGVRGKVLIYPINEEAVTAAEGQEYLSLFTILRPGSLEAQLRRELSGADNVIRQLQEPQVFGPADADATGGYHDRLARINPLDARQLMGVQAEIWNAWLRLWGLNSRRR